MLNDIEKWMITHKFDNLKDFRGLMHNKKIEKRKIQAGYITD